MNRCLVLVALLGCVSVVSAADRPVGRALATRSVVYTRHGMVAAAHPLLGFLEPTSCGLGGDLFAMVWDPRTARLSGLNASGRAPAALTIDRVPAEEDGTIPVYSVYSWTVPGCADGWFELHRRYGKLPMAAILAPAARLAREGAPVPAVIADAWAAGARRFADSPGFAAVFMPGGRAPAEGEVFANPALAATYELLAEGGRAAFYEGEVARRLVAFSDEVGGFLSLADLAAHTSEWVEPISTTYRGMTVWELPPNPQGLAALQMLNILEGFDLAAMGRDSTDFWHLLVEAKKLAYEDRARFYADPAFAAVPVAGLLDKAYAAERAARIDMQRAAASVAPGNPAVDGGDTTFLATADADGMMVSLIQSNYTGFGSGHAVPSLGFGLQDRGALFSLDPAHPNALAPGKRPFHTIIPAFMGRGGVPDTAFGVMGGDMQPQGHVQIVVNLVDFGMNLQEAGDAPRFHHTGSSEPTGTVMTDGGVVHLESGLPPEVYRDLARRGHRIIAANPAVFGGYQAIRRDAATGVLAGASESRKDGMAAGY
ncbi:MAG: gamma-glutamyltransferase family protein [Thermoanaerobaculales bacterium]|nr:gamma-glutamyltransferase family protein [Thermoanaerobaculales bacterium]